jgi:hypothetical protein
VNVTHSSGPLHRFFSEDHDRLDGLLQQAIGGDGPEVRSHIETNMALARRARLL